MPVLLLSLLFCRYARCELVFSVKISVSTSQNSVNTGCRQHASILNVPRLAMSRPSPFWVATRVHASPTSAVGSPSLAQVSISTGLAFGNFTVTEVGRNPGLDTCSVSSSRSSSSSNGVGFIGDTGLHRHFCRIVCEVEGFGNGTNPTWA